MGPRKASCDLTSNRPCWLLGQHVRWPPWSAQRSPNPLFLLIIWGEDYGKGSSDKTDFLHNCGWQSRDQVSPPSSPGLRTGQQRKAGKIQFMKCIPEAFQWVPGRCQKPNDLEWLSAMNPTDALHRGGWLRAGVGLSPLLLETFARFMSPPRAGGLILIDLNSQGKWEPPGPRFRPSSVWPPTLEKLPSLMSPESN